MKKPIDAQASRSSNAHLDVFVETNARRVARRDLNQFGTRLEAIPQQARFHASTP